MKQLMTVFVLLSLHGCASQHAQQDTASIEHAAPIIAPAAVPQQCLGDTALPAELADQFDAVDDDALRTMATDQAGKGKLCQGKVYRSKKGSNVTLYRAWNSTNPNTRTGNWWAFQQPEGKVAQYRADYEICYQWTPLDKLERCKLNPGATVVVGTGQSVECSPYSTYPVSDKKQIYIADATALISDCTLYDGEFSWRVEAASGR